MTAPYYKDDLVELYHGDCIEIMRTLPDSSVHAVITDPPYGLGFMGREWDDLPPGLDFATEALRVLKPGGHLVAFGGSRTWHRLAVAVEDAGFEIRDSIAWLYGSGFPKSLDVSKAIDKAAGVEVEKGANFNVVGDSSSSNGGSKFRSDHPLYEKRAPATDAAREWQGWGTALKPAFEPIVVGRKPFAGTVAANVMEHGTGALNIDGCRIDASSSPVTSAGGRQSTALGYHGGTAANGSYATKAHAAGRWPTNVLLDDSQAAELDGQAPRTGSWSGKGATYEGSPETGSHIGTLNGKSSVHYGDMGGASRFFPTFRSGEASADKRYTEEGATNFAPLPGARRETVSKSEMFPTFHYEAKAPSSERPDVDGTQHPTVKPLDLMRWLVRLVTPPGGVILEPFAGSGTTLEAALIEGFNVIGIEREADYLPLIMQRITKPLQQSLDFGAIA